MLVGGVSDIHPLPVVVVGTPPPHFAILRFGLAILDEPPLVDFEGLINLIVAYSAIIFPLLVTTLALLYSTRTRETIPPNVDSFA